jgi:CheY-like chemotaxis protein
MDSKIPIIALTADVTTVDLAKCKSVGMNDYISKPVDERVLYSKIVGLVKEPMYSSKIDNKDTDAGTGEQKKCTDLKSLNIRTKSNPVLMMEMISLFLIQTPILVKAMKDGFLDNDWISLQSAAHKMIPSFAIMGISQDFETMARRVQEYATNQLQSDGMYDLVLQIENVCVQACRELEIEFNRIKSNLK